MLGSSFTGKGGSVKKPVLEFRYPDRKLFMFWNLAEKIAKLTGKRPSISRTDNMIFIIFKSPIEDADKIKLDELMEQKDPSLPPDSPDKLVIKDLEKHYKELGGELWIGSSDGVQKDRIEIHFDHELGIEEKDRIINTYANFARFE